MIEELNFFLSSVVLGIMIFFSFVVAPITFKSLSEESARIFIRTIFPYYYNLNLLFCLLITFPFFYLSIYSIKFYLILSTTILFGISSFILMPLINKYRDNKDDKKFKYLHFLSVLINFIQIVFLTLFIF
tara:strand:- start:1701 stop:2090 length:390 start_codon:yes stop_codon:yes gene_type:complete